MRAPTPPPPVRVRSCTSAYTQHRSQHTVHCRVHAASRLLCARKRIHHVPDVRRGGAAEPFDNFRPRPAPARPQPRPRHCRKVYIVPTHLRAPRTEPNHITSHLHQLLETSIAPASRPRAPRQQGTGLPPRHTALRAPPFHRAATARCCAPATAKPRPGAALCCICTPVT